MSDNRWVLMLWAALALLACGKTEPPPVTERAFVVAAGFNPVKECQTTSFGRYVRGASCPGAELLFISRAPAPKVWLEHMRSELVRLGQTVEARSLLVNGQEHDALSITYGPIERPIVSTLVTTLAMPGATDSIEVQCFARERPIDPKRCRSLLDSFIEQGLLRGEWPSVLAQAAARRSIQFNMAGREVLLPSDCDELGLFDVDCSDGHVQMYILERPDQLQPALSALLAHRRNETLLLEREIPCAVDGLPTQCIVRKSRLPFGDELHAYHAALPIRGIPVLVACETKRSRATLLPGALCSRFFSFELGALDEPPVAEE